MYLYEIQIFPSHPLFELKSILLSLCYDSRKGEPVTLIHTWPDVAQAEFIQDVLSLNPPAV